MRFDVSAITDVLTRSQNTLETNHKKPPDHKREHFQVEAAREWRQLGSGLAAASAPRHAHMRAGARTRKKRSTAAYSLRCEQRPFLQSHIQRFIEDILLGVVQNEPCPQSSSNFTLAE